MTFQFAKNNHIRIMLFPVQQTLQKIKQVKSNVPSFTVQMNQVNDRTSGIPNLYYQEGRLDEYVTNERYSGNGKRGYKHPKQHCILRLWSEPEMTIRNEVNINQVQT